jgi:hypothetical protein
MWILLTLTLIISGGLLANKCTFNSNAAIIDMR